MEESGILILIHLADVYALHGSEGETGSSWKEAFLWIMLVPESVFVLTDPWLDLDIGLASSWAGLPLGLTSCLAIEQSLDILMNDSFSTRPQW